MELVAAAQHGILHQVRVRVRVGVGVRARVRVGVGVRARVRVRVRVSMPSFMTSAAEPWMVELTTWRWVRVRARFRVRVRVRGRIRGSLDLGLAWMVELTTWRSALACSSRLADVMSGRRRMRPPTVKALPCRRAVALICSV
jgi:hypothetical protein